MSSVEWFADRSYWADNRSFIWSERMVSYSEPSVGHISRLLGMQKGESVLDLACGFGRHSFEFSKRGLSVTGVDLNPDLIDEANRNVRKVGQNCRFVIDDMREYSKSDLYDYVVILYNSFGYFDDKEDDRRVVRNCYRSLKPGGKLLISHAAREIVFHKMNSEVKQRTWREDDGVYTLIEWTINEDWSRCTCSLLILDGTEKKSWEHSIRIYSEPEMAQLLTDEGFTHLGSYGNYKGDVYDENATHLVIVAEKPS